MNSALRFAAPLLLLAGVAGCDSIGEGNTIETLEIVVTPVAPLEQGTMLDADTANERLYMYDCFCSNIAAVATFTDGTRSNFSGRATFTSDNPSVVTVLNFGDVDTLCPAAQRGAGLTVPTGLGVATITARFASLSASFRIEVADASPGTYVLEAAPPSDPANTDVAVGAQLPLRVTGTLDGRTRDLTESVTWSFDAADADVATIDSAGVVRGVSLTGATGKTARATFGTCNDVSPTAVVNVGEVLGPIVLEREAPDFATDGMLAVGTDEQLKATTPLDFDADGGSDGTQLISSMVGITFTDSCTLRQYDASVAGSNCRDTVTTCANTISLCASSTNTSCPSTLVEGCRTEASPINATTTNRIVAAGDNGSPTNFTATFPNDLGTPTTLGAALDASATTLTVAALTGYPTEFPWYGVIDLDGAREDVRVTGADGTTLTVVRGIGGTAAATHASGVSFEQRSYTSDPNAPLPIRGKDGTLTEVALAPPGTLVALGTLQLSAVGTFVDAASASRQQRVTREVDWLSSDSTVATVGAGNGLAVSTTVCGGRVQMRARAGTSTDTTTATFDSTTTADDDACENTDPLCDQVELCIATPSPLPLGATCDTVTTCP